MADASIVREFLVKLGFNVDLPGQTRFIDGVIEATKAVAELAAGSIAAAGAVVLAVSKMASASDDLYFISQRTKSSASNILAFGYAAAQMGSSVEAARSSLEGLANTLRSSPGAKGLLASLGINPNEPTTQIMSDLGARFAKMPTYLAQNYAARFGIDQNTMRAMIQGMGQYTEEYADLLKKAGIGSDAGTAAAHGFMVQLRSLGNTLDVLGMKVGITLYKGMGDNIKRFTQLIQNNFGAISDTIVNAAKVILNFADVIIHLITRASQLFQDLATWYTGLDKNTKQLIKNIGLLTAAWWLLDAALDASPLGILALLAGAVLLLYDDWKTWKEGGKHLIDWDYWDPEVRKALATFKSIIAGINDVIQFIGGWKTVLWSFASWMAVTWLFKVLGVFASVAEVLAFAGPGGILAGIAAITAGMVAFIALSNKAAVDSIPFKGTPEEQFTDRKDTLAGGTVTPNVKGVGDNGGWGAFGGTRLGKWFRSKLPASMGGTGGAGAKGDPTRMGGGGGTGTGSTVAVNQDISPVGRAFLDQIASGESDGSYNEEWGGSHFSSYADHPRKEFDVGNGTETSAAGRYQFEKATWDDVAGKLGLKDFSPKNQDIAAWYLAKRDYSNKTGGRDLEADLKSKNYDTYANALNVLHKTWSSMSGTSAQVGALSGRIQDATKNAHGAIAKAATPPPITNNTPAVGPGSPGYGVDQANVPSSAAWRTSGGPANNNMPISQTNHITVNGAGDPHATAHLITKAQSRVNSDLIRNVQTRAV